jgi:hypothetical protein
VAAEFVRRLPVPVVFAAPVVEAAEMVMVTEPEEHSAEVVPFRAKDIHYEHEIDQPPDGTELPALVGEVVADTDDEWLPVVPHWASADSLRYFRARAMHATARHTLHSPEYLAKTLVYSVRGVFKLTYRQIYWWWVLEQHELRSLAAAAGDSREWRSLTKVGRDMRKVRGWILAGQLAGLGLGVALTWNFTHWFGIAGLSVVALPWLAHYGRPHGARIISPATVTARFRVISADVVLRAYYAAGLGHAEKPDMQVGFGSPMQRDGDGSRVVVMLPYGKGLKDAIEKKDEIASGLDVTTSQVFFRRDPTSARLHTLWVADRDPLAVPVGRTPLLACKQTDIWRAAPMGLDERGSLVKVDLMWQSVLVGALPRQGKTFAARLLALYCALDPYVKLDVFDAKGSPDWRKFALVADSFAFGLTPTREGLPPEIFLNTLESVKADVQDRYNRLSEMPTDICPHGKLTREIARDPRFRMPVRVLVLDEFQEWFDLGEISKDIAALLVFLLKVAPGAGVSVIGATQKPSGIGTGQVGTQFNSFRDNFAVRFGLRTSSWQVSEMVLGQGAYSEGLDTSTLLPQYKGVGILRGATDASPTTRTHLADGKDAEKILKAARALRERAGTLSGMALGEDTPATPSILDDVLAVLGDETAAHWETLAELLRKHFPDRRGDETAESVSASCRGAGVPSVDVWRDGRSRMGCRREHLEAAIKERRQ